MLLGAFTANNNPKDSTKAIKFGTQYIQGNKIFIEYQEPKNSAFEGEISIVKVVHVFMDLFSKSGPFGGSGNCNINVSCPEGFGWQNEINSVTLILGYNNNNNLAAWCSGALINNTNEDGIPLFLTANHCIDGNINQNSLYDYSTWLFLFNHQTTTCSSNGSDVSSYTGQSVYGAILLAVDGAGSPTSDYALLELNTSEQILASYGVCYAGWSLTTSPQAPFTGIHHPSGDVKKISIDQNPVTSTFYLNNQLSQQADHWMVNWNQGTTEGGSSGSPLFNSNHQIIGQLHGGDAACNGGSNNGLPDWYGKFSTSWQNGGFAFWLDPYNTGQTSVNTYCPVYTGDPIGGGGGGSGGGGGGNNPCAESVGRRLDVGYLINGKRDEVIEVCINNPITLTGIHPITSCPQAFSPNIEVKSRSIFTGGCGSLPSGAYGCNTTLFTCVCYYAKLFISVTLVDANLNPVNPEFTNWMPFQAPELSYSGTDALIPSFDLRNHLPSPYIIFQSGQTYRIKIATSDFNGWSEYTNYIHFYTDNRTINNANITSNIYGKFITINNSTVTQPIEVVAKELITINPNSTLYAGTYRIDPVLGCNDFMRIGQQGVNSYTNKNNIYISGLTDRDIINNINENTSNSNLTIYPNPTNGLFTLELKNVAPNNLVEIYDIMGKKIWSKIITKNKIQINIAKQSKGIYLVKVLNGNKVSTQKIVYE